MDCLVQLRSQETIPVTWTEDGDVLEQCAKQHSSTQLNRPFKKNLTKLICTDHLPPDKALVSVYKPWCFNSDRYVMFNQD